jgi:hypothetical protein
MGYNLAAMSNKADISSSRVESLLELIAEELQLVLLRMAKDDPDEDQGMVEQHGRDLTSRVEELRRRVGLS